MTPLSAAFSFFSVFCFAGRAFEPEGLGAGFWRLDGLYKMRISTSTVQNTSKYLRLRSWPFVADFRWHF